MWYPGADRVTTESGQKQKAPSPHSTLRLHRTLFMHPEEPHEADDGSNLCPFLRHLTFPLLTPVGTSVATGTLADPRSITWLLKPVSSSVQSKGQVRLFPPVLMPKKQTGNLSILEAFYGTQLSLEPYNSFILFH